MAQLFSCGYCPKMQKQTFALWNKGVEQFRQKDFSEALITFNQVGRLSKVLFNIGMVYNNCFNHDAAKRMFSDSIFEDNYFAVSHLQKGYSLFMMSQYSAAEKSLKYCYKLLLDNDFIDYNQLNLKFILFRFEILVNLAVCNETMGKYKEADDLFAKAKLIPRTPEHHLAIMNAEEGGLSELPFFSVPLDTVFQVSELKLRNLKKKDFLENAVLIRDEGSLSISPKERVDSEFIGFSGAALIEPGLGGGTLIAARKKRVKGRSHYRNISEGSALCKADTFSGRRPDRNFNATLHRNNSEPIKPSTHRPNKSQPIEIEGGKSKSNTSDQFRNLHSNASKNVLEKQIDSLQSSFQDNFALLDNDRQYYSGNSDTNIRVKIHTSKETKSLRAYKYIPLEKLLEEIHKKLDIIPSSQTLCFQNPDDNRSELLPIIDQSDLDLALALYPGLIHLYLQ